MWRAAGKGLRVSLGCSFKGSATMDLFGLQSGIGFSEVAGVARRKHFLRGLRLTLSGSVSAKFQEAVNCNVYISIS